MQRTGWRRNAGTTAGLLAVVGITLATIGGVILKFDSAERRSPIMAGSVLPDSR